MNTLRELLSGTALEHEETFSAPWEARSFAIAVGLAESGVFTWDEFRHHLIDEIAKAERVPAHAWIDSGEGYYTHFMRALEALLREKQILSADALEARMRELGPHGEDDHHEDGPPQRHEGTKSE